MTNSVAYLQFTLGTGTRTGRGTTGYTCVLSIVDTKLFNSASPKETTTDANQLSLLGVAEKKKKKNRNLTKKTTTKT